MTMATNVVQSSTGGHNLYSAEVDSSLKETAAALVCVASSVKREASKSLLNLQKMETSATEQTQKGPEEPRQAWDASYFTKNDVVAGVPVPTGQKFPSRAPNYERIKNQAPPRNTSLANGNLRAQDTRLCISSIGFGIDPYAATYDDATEAAFRALRDALERSSMRLPASDSMSVQVELGVPAKKSGNEPMTVDTDRLASLLPQSSQRIPFRVVVGAIMISPEQTTPLSSFQHLNQPPPTNTMTCTAIACVTVKQFESSHTALNQHDPKPSIPMSIPMSNPWPLDPSIAGPWHRIDQSQQRPATPSPVQRQHPQKPLQQHARRRSSDSKGSEPKGAIFNRTSSIEMLATISQEMHERQLIGKDASGSEAIESTVVSSPGNENPIRSAHGSLGDLSITNSSYNYKKLPPGVTPKNNKRLFVKHSYRDHSVESPLPEEQYLVRPSTTRTPNAAFPLKLHETLTQIELDGFGHIIGWLPHGRSFKILEQTEFINIILPKYFVMTKKSSFLRQLNLYGFNRLSGVGPDQGSYYHEKFLRGLKFLCRRMARQKINGNGIRAAGNPDEEPVLSRYAICPPTFNGTAMPDSGASTGEYTQVSPASAPEEGGKKSSVPEAYDETVHEVRKGNGAKAGRASTGNSVVQVSFPLKLQRILDKLEVMRKTDIISWLPHGRAFLVRNPDLFVSELMPQYFQQTKFSSFQRQLHMYNFQRITTGRDKGAYHHPSFQRGRPQLCLSMGRTRVNGKGCRRPGNPKSEPDLHLLEPAPPIPEGTFIDVPSEMPAVNNDDEMEPAGSSDES